MSYIEIRTVLPSHIAEKLSDALMENGALSSAIEDAYAGTSREQPIFGEPNEPTAVWEQSLVIALFDDKTNVDSIFQAACQNIHIKPPEYKKERLPEKDWVRMTQAQFDPIRISERLWIVPSWHNAPDEAAINIKLDPGLAFGTGSHPTTRLCLQWLDQNATPNDTVLDYGCGSGILAVAALKLGVRAADGVDIDPQAVESAQFNAENNGVTAHFVLPENCPNKQYSVVVANILANPLRMLGDLLASKTQSGGRIVLSGILAEQADEISAIYQQWFDMQTPTYDDGWACLSGVKRYFQAA